MSRTARLLFSASCLLLWALAAFLALALWDNLRGERLWRQAEGGRH